MSCDNDCRGLVKPDSRAVNKSNYRTVERLTEIKRCMLRIHVFGSIKGVQRVNNWV